MLDDYEVVTTAPLHLELMLQPPDQGATASQDDQGCEVETSLTSLEPPTSSTQPERTTKTSKQQSILHFNNSRYQIAITTRTFGV